MLYFNKVGELMKKLKINNILVLISILFVLFVIVFMIIKIIDLENGKSDYKTESGNKTKEEVKTGESPKINLYGEDKVKVVKNGIYEDLGASASDEEDGDLTSKINVRSDMVYKVPSNVKDEEVAMVEPTAVGLHAIHLADVKVGDKVLVIGAGPAGSSAAFYCAQAGLDTLLIDKETWPREKIGRSDRAARGGRRPVASGGGGGRFAPAEKLRG